MKELFSKKIYDQKRPLIENTYNKKKIPIQRKNKIRVGEYSKRNFK